MVDIITCKVLDDELLTPSWKFGLLDIRLYLIQGIVGPIRRKISCEIYSEDEDTLIPPPYTTI